MKKIISIIIAIISILTITACNRELTGNKTADDALNAINKIVAANNDKKGFHKALQHWGLALSGNDKFEWSKDTSANAADFAMVINAEPLINAGLDTSKLSSDWLVNEAKEENGVQIPVQIIHPYNISDKKETSQGSEDAFRRLLKQKPDVVTYHSELSHYRLMLGDGFEVQWTEKLGLNDADMIFVIAADPLIEAGLDITKLQDTGWIFKEAGMDPTGMGENPNQLIKIYKLT